MPYALIALFFSSPVSLLYGVEGLQSIVRRLVLSVRSITPTVLKMISPYCIHIFVMYVGCAQKNIVAPSLKLNSERGQT